MGLVVTYITEDPTAVCSCCGIPVIEEDGVGELVKGHGKNDEEGGWHDKSVFIHGKVVMDTVEEKMSRYAHSVVRQVSAGMT